MTLTYEVTAHVRAAGHYTPPPYTKFEVRRPSCSVSASMYIYVYLRVSRIKLYTDFKEKKRSERRKHCTLSVVRRSQKYSPADPLPGGFLQLIEFWPKFNQLEMVTTFTYKPSLVRID